jgi:hypothetical protein
MLATSRTILIRNRSRTSNLTLDVGTLTSPFAVSGAGHYLLLPGASTLISVVFSPDTVGMASQILWINSGDPKRPLVNVTVSGMVQPGRLSAPRKVALTAKSGSATTKTVILRNSGKGMLSGTVQPFQQGSPLELMDGPVSFALAPGQTQSVTIQFTPASTGTLVSNLAIDTKPPPGTTTIQVTGSGR